MNKKLRRNILGICILIFLVYVGNCKQDATALPSTYTGLSNEEKVIYAEDCYEAGTLSYGPYVSVPKGTTLVVLHYDADCEGNSVDVVSLTAGKTYLKEGLFSSKNWYFSLIETDSVDDLEIRTYYNGQGDFEVKAYYIFPISGMLGLLIVVALLLLVFYMSEHEEKFSIYIAAGVILFLLNLFSVQSVLVGTYFFMFVLLFLMYEKGKEECIFAAINMLSVFWMEVLNYKFYSILGTYFMETFLYSLLIFFEIYFIMFFVVKNYAWKKYVTGVITIIILVYGTAQYIYYSLFNNFFNLKAVRLLSTAMGATSSIEELFGRYGSKYYFLNLTLFLFVYSISIILVKKPKLMDSISEKERLVTEFVKCCFLKGKDICREVQKKLKYRLQG